MKEGTFQSEQPGDRASTQQQVAGTHLGGDAVPVEDWDLIKALRNGSESAFVSLIDQYHTSMLRLAMVFVASQGVAEEVVQETWIGVLQGLDRFEGRSSLKTWIFRILTNRAKTRAQREGRSVPFSSIAEFAHDTFEPAVEVDRFSESDDHRSGHWISIPRSWDEIPENRILSQETMARIQEAIETLPPGQREIITLRDIEGWSSNEACNLLGVSESNQRVLLHRARSRVRHALERYFEEE